MGLRELRNTRQLKNWLRRGETVELREHNRPIAIISPAPPEKFALPDFAARTRAIFGGKRLPAVKWLIEDRRKSRH